MAFSEIISSFIEEFINSKKGNIRYISLPESVMKDLPSKLDSSIQIIDLANNYSPLKPFLQILSSASPSSDVINREVYSQQQESFYSYFKYGVCKEREDSLIHEQVFYEKLRYKESIVSMFSKLCKENYVILNSQFLCEETVSIIESLEQTNLNAKLIFCFDSIKIEASSKNVLKFFERISSEKNFFDVSNIKVEISKEEDDGIYLESTIDYDTLVNSIRNNRVFLSLEQGIQLCEWASLNVERLGFNSFQARLLYIEIALTYYYNNQTDEAILFFTNVLEHQYDDEITIRALIYITNILIVKNENEIAIKYTHLIKDKLKNSKDSPYYAIALMTEYRIIEKKDKDDAMIKYKEALDKLEQHGFINNYITCLLVIPWVFINNEISREEIIPYIDKALKMSQEIDNQFSYASAAQWRGIVESFNGNGDNALEWYYLSNKIRTEIGELSQIIKIRNGLSYEALIRAEYRDSYDLINSFISRLEEINDYSEIINTLKNLAYSLFYSRHFSESYSILQKIIYFIHVFHMDASSYNSFIPQFNDILIYKTIIDLENEDLIRAKINLHNIKNNGHANTDIEDTNLAFIEALVSLEEKEIESSLNKMEYCIKLFEKQHLNEKHRKVFLLYSYSEMLKRNGFDEESEHYFKLGHELAKDLKLYKLYGQANWGLKEYLQSIENFDKVKLNLTYIEEKAEKERLMNQLHARLHDYQFLNKIMAFGTDTSNIKSYIKNVSQAISDYCMAKAVYIAEETDGSWKIISSVLRGNIQETNFDWENIISSIRKINISHLVFNYENNIFVSNLSKFKYNCGLILIPSQQKELNTDTLNTMNIALSNIQSQLIMLKQNENLIYISSTDQLSMLKNRRSLQDYIATEHEKLSRSLYKKNYAIQETIMFIDLDNFKYYNDNFGHDAGDILISSFAKLLKNNFRKIDFIARFGGDEFIIILTDTSPETAYKLGSKLYEALDNAQYFIPELETLIGKKLSIDKSKYLGFSLGICSNYDIEDRSNLDKVMTLADQALYHSKETGKGKITLWSDINNSKKL